MGSSVGALKTAARRVGATLDQYQTRMAMGERWCTGCKSWHPVDRFSVDRTRGFGISASCQFSKRGPRHAAPAEKEAARYAVNLAVRYGRLPKANSVPCTDCAHVWTNGERRHEYDHFQGYGTEHRLTVQAVCTLCHADREKERRHGRKN